MRRAVLDVMSAEGRRTGLSGSTGGASAYQRQAARPGPGRLRQLSDEPSLSGREEATKRYRRASPRTFSFASRPETGKQQRLTLDIPGALS